jgi:hypothetical protein
VTLDQTVVDAEVREEDRGSQAATASTDDEHGDVEISHGDSFP